MCQTLRRLGGRHPLCGTGVISLMPVTSIPAFWIERIAVSRPDPGPLTCTSTRRTPCSIALRAASSAACCAANGVDFREPLNPTLPAEAQETTFPFWSLKLIMVLLNELLICATPWPIFFRSLRRGRRAAGCGSDMFFFQSFSLPAITSGPSFYQRLSFLVPFGCERLYGSVAL